MLQTTEREAVKAARKFVREVCLQELEPEALNRLKGLYRPPKIPAGRKRRAMKSGRVRAELFSLCRANLVLGDPPQESESAQESGHRIAESKRKRRRTHFLDEFHWSNDSICQGETVVQVVDEVNESTFVCPPAGSSATALG